MARMLNSRQVKIMMSHDPEGAWGQGLKVVGRLEGLVTVGWSATQLVGSLGSHDCQQLHRAANADQILSAGWDSNHRTSQPWKKTYKVSKIYHLFTICKKGLQINPMWNFSICCFAFCWIYRWRSRCLQRFFQPFQYISAISYLVSCDFLWIYIHSDVFVSEHAMEDAFKYRLSGVICFRQDGSEDAAPRQRGGPRAQGGQCGAFVSHQWGTNLCCVQSLTNVGQDLLQR